MSALTYSSASICQRVQMLEEVLEKVLHRDGMQVVSGDFPGEMAVCVADEIYQDQPVRHSLNAIAREMEALLP